VLGTVGVFWLAHVYAGVLAREDDTQPRFRAIGIAARDSIRHTAGLLTAMVLPAIFLLLAVVGWVDEYVAYYAALWVGVVVLAVLGYLASARRGSPWQLRFVSALVTASLGLLIIWLSSLVH
jgi:high-affinity Fe2+/Pb2+ permease